MTDEEEFEHGVALGYLKCGDRLYNSKQDRKWELRMAYEIRKEEEERQAMYLTFGLDQDAGFENEMAARQN